MEREGESSLEELWLSGVGTEKGGTKGEKDRRGGKKNWGGGMMR